MRLVFAGTPAFAAVALEALLAAGHEIALVLTQPDRAAGRGLKPAPSAVKRLALERGLALYQPPSLRAPQALEPLEAARAEAIVVVAYGLILPRALLALAPHGAINIHASLLPRWRGPAPIQRALLAGDRETGITIMQMDEGLDTGPILAQQPIAIAPDDDAGTLHDRLAALGARMIVVALEDIAAGRARAVPQPAEGACYAPKIAAEETVVDWSRPCAQIERQIRALRPAPGARTRLRDEEIKLWRADCVARSGAPGTVLEAGPALLVACGEGALAVRELQRAGGRRLPAGEFLRGRRVSPGERLGAAC